MASQIYAGLDGLAKKSDPGPSADTPYETQAPPLPKSLREALSALAADAAFKDSFGAAFIDYFIRLKTAEVDRFTAEAVPSGDGDVTVWEQNEYFDMF